MTLVEIRDRLRKLGYDARLVNGDSFDIHQNGFVHYLSRTEAESLNRAGLDLMGYSERRGLNRWYDFSDPNPKLDREIEEFAEENDDSEAYDRYKNATQP